MRHRAQQRLLAVCVRAVWRGVDPGAQHSGQRASGEVIAQPSEGGGSGPTAVLQRVGPAACCPVLSTRTETQPCVLPPGSKRLWRLQRTSPSTSLISGSTWQSSLPPCCTRAASLWDSSSGSSAPPVLTCLTSSCWPPCTLPSRVCWPKDWSLTLDGDTN